MATSIRRISRRTLLTDLGAGGVGLVFLGACGGSSDSASPTAATAAGDDGAIDAPATTAPAVTSSGNSDADDKDADDSAEAVGPGELRFQHVSLGFVSAYVLVRGSEAAIVDTGTSGSRADILSGLDAFSLGPDAVRHIVLTHNHGDHAGGLSDLEADMAGATVYGGVGDIETIRSALSIQELADGDEVFGMGVIGTPGHTPGSISLFDTETGLLVAGDAINGDGTGGLTGANPDFSADMGLAGESVERLAAVEPSIAAFGHGGAPVTDDVAAKLAALSGA